MGQRYRAGRGAAMTDRPSRPYRSPTRTPTWTERTSSRSGSLRRWGRRDSATYWVCTRRRCTGCSPATAWQGCAGSTVPAAEWCGGSRPPPAASWCTSIGRNSARSLPAEDGRCSGEVGGRNSQANRDSGRFNKSRQPLRGHPLLHTALDGHSRLVYSEILTGKTLRQRSGSVSTLGRRARVHARTVLTDNGSCYRSHAFRDALGTIEHRRTRPYPTAYQRESRTFPPQPRR